MKIVREMGYTHADIFRLLPNAIGDYPFQVEGQKITCQLNTGSLTITLGPEGERRLVLVFVSVTTLDRVRCAMPS